MHVFLWPARFYTDHGTDIIKSAKEWNHRTDSILPPIQGSNFKAYELYVATNNIILIAMQRQ